MVFRTIEIYTYTIDIMLNMISSIIFKIFKMLFQFLFLELIHGFYCMIDLLLSLPKHIVP